MTYKEFAEYCDKVRGYYDEWLDKQSNLLEQPISEMMGNAFFYGYKKGQEIICKKILEELEKHKDLKGNISAGQLKVIIKSLRG